jgi:hypothetical protein
MTTTTTAPATAPEVTNLRDARKAQAASRKAHPAGKATPAKKAPAKAPAKRVSAKATTKAPAPAKQMFTAVGRSSQAVFRQFSFDAKFTVDVSDPKAVKPLPKAGQIWAFFATKEKAEAAATRLRGKGYNVLVVAAKPATKPVTK